MQTKKPRSLILIIWWVCCYTAVQGQSPCECPQYATIEPAAKAVLSGQNKEAVQLETVLRPLWDSKDKLCEATACELLARYAYKRGNLDSAEIMANRALQIRTQQQCPEDALLDVYKTLNNVYNNRAAFDKAMEMELKINAIFVARKDTNSMAMSYLNLANIFNRVKQEEKALSYCRIAIPLVEQIGNAAQKVPLYTRAAQRYLYAYESLNRPPLLDTSEIYALRAYDMMQTNALDKEVQFAVRLRLSTIAIKKKEFDKALRYIEENLRLSDRQRDNSQVAICFSDRAEVLMLQNKFTEARFWADSALIYQKRTQSPPQIANVYNLIYTIAQKANDPTTALWAFQQEKTITDSLHNVARTEAVTLLEKKYNQAKNEQKIAELAQEKRLYLLLALLACAAVLAIVFYVRQQVLRHKQKILEAEQRLNRARMNPHFFFNALASLQSFALRENDGKVLATNLSKFSNIMRETLESTYKEYVTIEQEMDFLNEYLEIQKIRFPKKFSFAVHASLDLEPEALLIPSMIIQPFVENAIEHGFADLPHEGHVDIHFSQSEKEILVAISDNGNGLGHLPSMKNEHVSRASQIIKDRIYLLNLKLKTTARFSIENKSGEKGVIVKIFLPILNNTGQA